jgi:aspartyl aminopeptidase
MSDPVADLLAFVERSPTPFHAVAETCARLDAAGFSSLAEADAWRLAPGDRRYVVRGGSSLLAFALGERPPAEVGFRVIGAHTDSPNLRLKPRPDLVAHGLRQLAVEPYGGLLLHTWLDRDLGLSGRLLVPGHAGGAPESLLVSLARPLLRIPSLAIHLQRELATEGLKLNAQQHAVPVLGLEDAPALPELLGAALRAAGRPDVAAQDVLGFDLMLHDVQPPSRGGARDELLFAPRLDNLESCHAAVSALVASAEAGSAPHTRLVVLYDHEEVGSRSAVGAGGTFLRDGIARCAGAFGAAPDALPRAAARSILVSADMAHGVHPNYADRHEPGHRPVLGRGPVIKQNVGQSYATEGETAARLTALCRRLGIAPQHFVTRSDLPCGSTIGPISAARAGLPAVDVGSPMFSMHSCREMAAASDVQPMIELLRLFLDDG